MDPTCVLYAPVITAVVAVLRVVPFLKNSPKIIAFLLSTALAAYHTFGHGGAALTWTLVSCVLATFSGSVATFEVGKTAVKSLTTTPSNES